GDDLDIDDEDFDGIVDIVELPQDGADDVSDLEYIVDNTLENTILEDIPDSIDMYATWC
ncbi:hypothetical protein NPIL_123461, partial [Nephila pilipes]